MCFLNTTDTVLKSDIKHRWFFFLLGTLNSLPTKFAPLSMQYWYIYQRPQTILSKCQVQFQASKSYPVIRLLNIGLARILADAKHIVVVPRSHRPSPCTIAPPSTPRPSSRDQLIRDQTSEMATLTVEEPVGGARRREGRGPRGRRASRIAPYPCKG